MKTFDELFNDFFKRNIFKSETKRTDELKEEAKKMIDILNKMNEVETNMNEIDESIEKNIDDNLGKPDKIEFFNENDLFFERRTWHTETGDLIKLIVSDDPTFGKTPKITKTLQQQLDEAVAEENYEKAAAIRDKLTSKKVRKSRKKPNND